MPIYRTTFVLDEIAAIREADSHYHLKGEYFYFEDEDSVMYAIIRADNEKDAYAKSQMILDDHRQRKAMVA